MQTRFLLFLVGCIGTRTLLCIGAKYASTQWLKYLGYLALLPAFGFAFLFVTGKRKTGPEVFGGKIWWNNLRPVHALLYFLFAYQAIHGNHSAWVFLMLDVILGLIAFLSYHGETGNITKLFV